MWGDLYEQKSMYLKEGMFKSLSVIHFGYTRGSMRRIVEEETSELTQGILLGRATNNARVSKCRVIHV